MAGAAQEPNAVAREVCIDLWAALGGRPDVVDQVRFVGEGSLPSLFSVSDLAASSIAVAGLAVAEWMDATSTHIPEVTVDRALASAWFTWSIRPEGWEVPPPWDPVAGDYRADDAWIRLHTNAPHHRVAALGVLGIQAVREEVASAVEQWKADELEDAIVSNGGAAARMRTLREWATHPQGQAVALEPLVEITRGQDAARTPAAPDPARPLAGIRVLDLTRVLAGPVATRFLAGYGADVLRVDSPTWDEPAVVPEVTLGKRCARIDARDPKGRARLAHLLEGADIVVHGYRPGALEHLGLGREEREQLRPGLVDVSLDAYGWSGPWRNRRGFDSLVQMSTGIAAEPMPKDKSDRPVPLPAQALDHATGYLMAAAAIRGLSEQRRTGGTWQARCSLARTAAVLVNAPRQPADEPRVDLDKMMLEGSIEETAWGPARRLRPPVEVRGASMSWDHPAGPLGASPAEWA